MQVRNRNRKGNVRRCLLVVAGKKGGGGRFGCPQTEASRKSIESDDGRHAGRGGGATKKGGGGKEKRSDKKVAGAGKRNTESGSQQCRPLNKGYYAARRLRATTEPADRKKSKKTTHAVYIFTRFRPRVEAKSETMPRDLTLFKAFEFGRTGGEQVRTEFFGGLRKTHLDLRAEELVPGACGKKGGIGRKGPGGRKRPWNVQLMGAGKRKGRPAVPGTSGILKRSGARTCGTRTDQRGNGNRTPSS